MGNKPQKQKVEHTKIIFIDVDGVLNNTSSDVSQLYVIEPLLLKLFYDFYKDINGIIVMSSTWRYTQTTRNKFLEKLNENHMNCQIYSYTPNFDTNRVEEILAWLLENTTYFDDNKEVCKHILPLDHSKYPDEFPLHLIKMNKKLTIENFIIFDDLDLRKESSFTHLIENHFIHVDKKTGLTLDDIKNAKKLI